MKPGDNPRLIIDTQTTAQTVFVGAAIGRCCEAGDIIALQGELGAGKTQLVRGLAEGLGLDPRQVSSPTFVMVQEYEREKGHSPLFPMLVHIDAYRLASDEDLASIGWHDQGRELRESAVVAIEWAALIRHALGDDLLWIDIAHEQHGRRVTLSAQGVWRARMQRVEQALRDAGLNLVEGAPP